MHQQPGRFAAPVFSEIVMAEVTTWDGEEFAQMDEKEARKLEKEDKVQILSDGFVSGLDLKYRHEFTGYQTREMRAAAPANPKPAKKKTAAKKKVAAKKSNK